jgi:hypothetical protein
LIERARDMLVRFLDTIQAAHISFLDEVLAAVAIRINLAEMEGGR